MKKTYTPLKMTNSRRILSALMLMSVSMGQLMAQSGNWDGMSTTSAGAGLIDHGNGVIQLINTDANGCQGAAVHESTDTYDPTTDGLFSKCYQVYFGCPDDDQIGADTKGDGLAFSFSKCGFTVGGCGGGLGYSFGCPQMITIEFDTWSSQGFNGFDNGYEGTGNEDQVAIHRNGEPSFAGKIAGANPGNLEDGLEHEVCISYDPATGVMNVALDGDDVLTHTMAAENRLENYFGAGGLIQTWSSGKDGATNPATVTDGADISDHVGGPLCASDITITSHTEGDVVDDCGPVTITASVRAPAGNSTDSLIFLINGIPVGVDYSAPYTFVWANPSLGDHVLSARSYYSPSQTTGSSVGVSISVEPCDTLDAQIKVDDQVFCQGDSVQLRAYPQHPDFFYQWFVNGSDMGVAQLADSIVWVKASGNYAVRIDNGSVPDTSATITMTQNPIPNADAGRDTSFCQGSGGVSLSASGGITYLWSPGVGLSDSTSATTQANPSQTTIFTLTVGDGVCTAIDSVLVTVDSSPVAYAGEDRALCRGDEGVQLSASGGTSYSWSPSTGLSNPNSSNPFASPTTVTTYVVTVGDGVCSDTDEVTITVHESPLADAGSDTSFCRGSEGVRLMATGGSEFNWSPAEGLNDTTVANPQALPAQTTTYSVVVSNGTCSDQDEVLVVVHEVPTADAGPDVSFCADSAGAMLNASGGGTYSWTPVDGLSDPGSATPFAKPDQTTDYTLTVTVGQCSASDVVNVTVEECIDPVIIPNTYTPNGDEVNDVWEIPGILSYADHRVSIFNRWGNEVFFSDHYVNPWDGTHNGEVLPFGTYYYIIKLNEKEVQGNVTIVR